MPPAIDLVGRILVADPKTISETNTPAPPAPGTGWTRRVLFPLFAIVVGLLPCLLLEAGLRLFAVGRPADNADLLSGFNRGAPLFEQRGDVYHTTLARTGFFSTQEFSVAKPRNGFRIFCFGGSTVYGHPYQAATAFPKWLELELNATDPAHDYQAINCGGISYASYRLALLVKEVLKYQPDLIILATGHNEFLEDRTFQSVKQRPALWAWVQDHAYELRTFTLLHRWMRGSTAAANGRIANDGVAPLSPEVRARLDNASGYASYHRDYAWHDNVIAQFDESVREIINDCRAAGVPILLVKLGSNLRDCPPFKSEHRAGLTPPEEREWQKEFDVATSLMTTNAGQALEHYLKAAAIDDEYALLNYRIARMADRLGQLPDALTYYGRARDEDVCPLRIIKPLEQALTRIAVRTGTPLLDAGRLLSADSFDYIPGFESYLDHVHPTIGGHQKIARALAAQMRECRFVPTPANWPEDQRRQTWTRYLQQLGENYFAEGKERVNWLENWARRQRLVEEARPDDALGYVRLGFRQLDLAEVQSAWQSLDEAIDRDATTIALMQKRAQELIVQGRPDYARSLRQHISAVGEGQTRSTGGAN